MTDLRNVDEFTILVDGKKLKYPLSRILLFGICCFLAGYFLGALLL